MLSKTPDQQRDGMGVQLLVATYCMLSKTPDQQRDGVAVQSWVATYCALSKTRSAEGWDGCCC